MPHSGNYPQITILECIARVMVGLIFGLREFPKTLSGWRGSLGQVHNVENQQRGRPAAEVLFEDFPARAPPRRVGLRRAKLLLLEPTAPMRRTLTGHGVMIKLGLPGPGPRLASAAGPISRPRARP